MKCEIESLLKNKKIPFFLNFGYTQFSFSFVDSLNDRQGELLGITDLNNHTIKFASILDLRQFKEVFFHEVFHVLVSFCGVVDPETEKITKLTEEDLVTRLSRGWLMFQNLNPNILALVNSL